MKSFRDVLCTLYLLGGLMPGCSATSGELGLGTLVSEVRGGRAAAGCEWPGVVGLDLGCSGTLVHPEVMIYAAHCGEGIARISFGEDLERPERVVSTRRCVAHPQAALGNGLDVAFCLLDEPIEDVPPIPIAAGCELELVREGAAATLVGFGPDQEGAAFGIKRSAEAVLDELGPDLVVSAAESGSCSGDSGGPLLMDVQTSGGGNNAARVIGVLSASDVERCARGTDHYSFVPDVLPWLEDASGRDLTPCFDATGQWDPGPDCTESPTTPSSASWNDACTLPGESELRSTCGAAFAVERLLETTPPELELLVPALPERIVVSIGQTFETRLEAVVRDAESGVADVHFELFDDAGTRLAEQRDEVPPYLLEQLSLPVGSWQMHVTARDHAGNERRRERSYTVATPAREASCSLGARSGGGGSSWLCLWAAMLAVMRRRSPNEARQR